MTSVNTRLVLTSLKQWFLRRHETTSTFAIGVTLIYAVLMVVGHAHHEMWRDEIHCWMIGRDATGLLDTIVGDRRYDGHPFLWYYLLHLLSRVYHHHVMLHIVAVTSAVIAAYLWMRHAPIPRYARSLYLLSYYVLFEYTIVSRAYGLGLMLTHLFCATFQPRKVQYIKLAVILSFLMLTSLYGTVIACSLALFLFTQPLEFTRRISWSKAIHEIRTRINRQWFSGLAIFVASLALDIKTSIPPKDAFFYRGWNITFSSAIAMDCLNRFFRGMVPLVKPELNFWKTNLLLDGKPPALFTRDELLFAGAALILAWCLIMRRRPRLVLTYLVGIGLMSFFQIATYRGNVRHWGHYSVLLFACLWLFATVERERRLSWAFQGLFTFVVGIQAVAGVVSYSIDYQQPFSGALEAAEYLQQDELKDLPLVGTSDALTSAVVGLIEPKRPFFSSETKQVITHIVYHNRRRSATQMQLLADARRRINETGRDAIIIATSRLGNVSLPGVTVQLIHRTRPSIEVTEDYLLYRVKRTPSPATPQ